MTNKGQLKVNVPVGENAAIYLIRRLRERRILAGTIGTDATIQLPKGEIDAFALGTHDTTWEVDCRFMGAGTLTLLGHPSGTEVLPHPWKGGTTIILDVGDAEWEGRVHLEGLDIFCSERAGVSTEVKFGDPTSITPYRDVTLTRCRLLSNPSGANDPTKREYWGITANQAAVNLINVRAEMPTSREHVLYNRNPCGGSLIDGLHVDGCGGNVLQYTNRPIDGPNYGVSSNTVRKCQWINYHRDASRAGYALTMAGSGQDWLVEDCVIADQYPAEHWPLSGGFPSSGGGLTCWNGGGNFYAVEDGTASYAYAPNLTLHSNGAVVVRRCQFGQPNGNREPIQFMDALSAFFVFNGVYSSNGQYVTSGATAKPATFTSGVATFTWQDNCSANTLAIAKKLGAAAGVLAPLGVVTDDGSSLGTMSGTYTR